MRFLLNRSLRKQAIAGILVALLLLPSMAFGQTPQPAAQQHVQSLRVVPLAGNGEENDLQRKIMAPLVVQVLDQNLRPVEGADVTFQFPMTGPTAMFPNQQATQTVRTNADGQAAAVGWTANNEVGTFQVSVTAIRGNETGEVSISMANVPRVLENVKQKRKSFWSSKWAKIGIIAGAAGIAVAVILLNRDSTQTITAVPGVPTIGGP